MLGFFGFMRSTVDRVLRVLIGAAVIVWGLFFVPSVGGLILVLVGTAPLVAGMDGVCLIAPFFGYTLDGRPRSVSSGS
jgi:hypothetical protein